jgi:hypothetical protein
VLHGQLAEEAREQDAPGNPLQHGVDELVLVGEIPVDDRLGDPGAAGDVVHGEVRPRPPDGLDGGTDEVLATGAPMLGPPRPPPVLVRLRGRCGALGACRRSRNLHRPLRVFQGHGHLSPQRPARGPAGARRRAPAFRAPCPLRPPLTRSSAGRSAGAPRRVAQRQPWASWVV